MNKIILIVFNILIVSVSYSQINLFLTPEGLSYVKKNSHIIKPINSEVNPMFYIGGSSLDAGYVENQDVEVLKKYIKRISISGSLSEYPKELEKLNNVLAVEICCFDLMPMNLFTHLAKYKKLETVSFSFPDSQAKYTLKHIGKLRHVKHLSLVGHGLTEMPSEIYKLKKMESISLAKNNFFYWPDSLCILNNLITIDFRYNRFEVIPEQDNFSCLPKLKYVSFSNNKIEDIPNWVKESGSPIITIR